jgi:hypothetical protein
LPNLRASADGNSLNESSSPLAPNQKESEATTKTKTDSATSPRSIRRSHREKTREIGAVIHGKLAERFITQFPRLTRQQEPSLATNCHNISESRNQTSGTALTSSNIISRSCISQASCRGTFPNLSLALTSAPFSSRISSTSKEPC